MGDDGGDPSAAPGRQIMQAKLVVRPAAQRQRQIGAVAKGSRSRRRRSAQASSASSGRGPRSGLRHRRRGQASRAGIAPCRRALVRATAAGRAVHRRADRLDRRARTCRAEIEAAADDQPASGCTFAASWARATPATGDSARGLGTGRIISFVPIWVQKPLRRLDDLRGRGLLDQPRPR